MKKLAIAGLAIASAFAFTACEKPNPLTTVWSGTDSVDERALCWSDTPTRALEQLGCAADVASSALEGNRAPELQVVPGDVVGISVDPKVADDGWIPVIGGQQLAQEPIMSTYFRFTFPDLQQVPADGIDLQIIATGETSSDLRGLWVYRLVPRP